MAMPQIAPKERQKAYVAVAVSSSSTGKLAWIGGSVMANRMPMPTPATIWATTSSHSAVPVWKRVIHANPAAEKDHPMSVRFLYLPVMAMAMPATMANGAVGAVEGNVDTAERRGFSSRIAWK